MKRSLHAFTLVEMLMVMVIIAMIASLIVGVAGYAQKKAASQRTVAEIKSLEVACEAYKSDGGSYPREVNTTEAADASSAAPIDPRKDGNPTATNYQNSSKFLYQQLTGDGNLDGRAGDDGAKVYAELPKKTLVMNTGGTQVLYLQDPYGLSYGYSTAGAAAEDAYREKAQKSLSNTTQINRDSDPKGFNSTFDLWSTGGSTTTPPTDQTRAKWLKNW